MASKMFLFLGALTSCLPYIMTSPLRDEQVSTVTIELLSEMRNPRHKRSAIEHELPDQLVFRVSVEGSDVTLGLKRTPLLPTMTSEGPVTSLPQDAAVFTDTTRHSSMIVKKEAGDYKLQGTFQHAGKEWNLKPFSRNTRSTDNDHQISPLPAPPKTQNINFSGDMFIDQNPIQRPRALLPRKAASSPPRRHRRAVTQHVIEMAFVVDFEDYNNWIDYVGASNAINEMTLWYTYIAESINIRYQTIQDPDIAIRTLVNSLKIITNDAGDAFIEDLVNSDGLFDGNSGLTAFRDYVNDAANGVPQSDHYMLFTGFDINGASGVAFGSAVCSPSSVSISENSFQATLGGIAAHELGHSLSSLHDVQEGCSDNDQFIMSTIFSLPIQSANQGNPWSFSSCSIAKFSSYLDQVTCTLPNETSSSDFLPAPSAGQRAGEVLTRDDQCRLKFQDSSSFYCANVQDAFGGGLEGICGSMYCSVPSGGGNCQTVLPLEFTPCGTDKWCVRGSCVNSIEPTTTTPETTTTTTTPEPTTTTTTPEPTTTTPEPTTTTTTPEPTTTTTTPEPTTTTTTPEPTTTTPEPTTTTTTPEPTTTTTTPEPTTTTPEPTTTTPEPTTTTTTTTEPTTTTTPEPTTTTTQPTTTTTTTTLEPATTTISRTTAGQEVTTTTTTTTTTTITPATTTESGPVDFYDCYKYLFRDWRRWWQCVRAVFRRQQEAERERRRREQERRRQQEEKRRQEQQRRREEQEKKREQERKRNQGRNSGSRNSQSKNRYPKRG